VGGLAVVLAGYQFRVSAAAAPSRSAISVGTSAEWHNNNGDSDETDFSQLAQITNKNAPQLGLAWSLDLPGEASLEGTPIAVNGILYFTGSYAKVYAVNGVSGKLLWTFDPKTWQDYPNKMNQNFAANRGVAYANGKIFTAALDGRLIALDVKTGRKIWATETFDKRSMQTITGAPRVFNTMVVIGQGGADMGQRGFVSAYDQSTGKQIWKFFVVPASPEENKGNAAMEAAEKTWNGAYWKKTGGGGGPWDSITFDKAMNRIYVGTANAAPYDPESRSPGGGDNLYTASIVALDATTGKYVWHYQVNPRDSWDYDCTQQITLAELSLDGHKRKVLMQAPKNGFFYVLDRETGKLISAEKLGKVNWADHIDMATGRPVENPNIRYETGESIIYPFTSGGHSFMHMSYNPLQGLVYVPHMQMGTLFRKGGEPVPGGVDIGNLSMGSAKADPDDGKGSLVAWDPVARKIRWSTSHNTIWNGGVVSTAGNVVFQGMADGHFSAYDAANGKQLWRSYAGMGIIASPMTYAVNGKQYVSILAGYGGSAAMLSDIFGVGWKYSAPRRLLTYALDGKKVLPKSPAPTFALNVAENASEVLDPKAATSGKNMFLACAACHGRNLVGAGGPAPDLRESQIPLNADAFYAVVHDGALMSRGMPAFKAFNRPIIENYRQYIRKVQRETLAQQKAQGK
jgi:quinohemoprotein ethanol dehydrogenase